MFGTTIAPMAAAINIIATTNQQNINTIIAGQAAQMSRAAFHRNKPEANNVVDVETTGTDTLTVNYKTYGH